MSHPARFELPFAVTIWLLILLAAGCATPVDDSVHNDGGEPFVAHEESSDFDPVVNEKADGIASSFNRNNLMTDEFFSDSGMMDAAAIQTFLEQTPYDKRSSLADEKVAGVPVSALIAQAAVDFQIDPILLLSPLQVEAGLVSKTATPSHTRRD